MKRNVDKIAYLIDNAAKTATAVQQISAVHQFDLNDAYAIQKLSIDQRLKRGEKLTGYKLGFTSRAKMEQMGVHEVIFGILTDGMHLENGASMDLNKFVHPRAEPEIAFRVSKAIDTVLTHENVMEYIDGVAAAIEVIDSRYAKFKFSLEDVVADNCSSSAYVIGAWHSPDTVVNHLDISLNINGEARKVGNSSAILGNPLDSMIEISKMSLKYEQPIQAGMTILAGAATAAEYLKSGDKIEAVFQTLGTVRLNVK